tara:strand:+ start:3478 stop:3828 length:351 start_codon:yes stop_codon:yes gene_type:complete
MEFDMKTPMLSRRPVPTSLKISSDMIKVGKVQHPRPFEERMKDYKGTYKCSVCNKSHFFVVKCWELTEDQDPNIIEKIISQEFSDQKISSRCEYYNKSMKIKILNRIDQLLTTESQ